VHGQRDPPQGSLPLRSVRETKHTQKPRTISVSQRLRGKPSHARDLIENIPRNPSRSHPHKTNRTAPHRTAPHSTTYTAPHRTATQNCTHLTAPHSTTHTNTQTHTHTHEHTNTHTHTHTHKHTSRHADGADWGPSY
jgi:hypothetical protein